MPRLIAKFLDRYCEWSTVVDAPVSHMMSEQELHEYIGVEYGANGLANLTQRLERVQAQGTSSINGTTSEDLLSFNRAGQNESHIATAEEMVAAYTARPARQ